MSVCVLSKFISIIIQITIFVFVVIIVVVVIVGFVGFVVVVVVVVIVVVVVVVVVVVGSASFLANFFEEVGFKGVIFITESLLKEGEGGRDNIIRMVIE